MRYQLKTLDFIENLRCKEVGFSSLVHPRPHFATPRFNTNQPVYNQFLGMKLQQAQRLEAALEPLEFITRAVGTNFDDSRHPK